MIYAMLIKHQSSFIVRSSFNYFPVYQLAATNSTHLHSTYTLHLQHLLRRVWNPIQHLRWSFFAEIVAFRPLAIFAEELHRECWQDSRCDFVQYLIIARRRSEDSFPSLGLHKGILDSPCLLILLSYTKHKTKK